MERLWKNRRTYLDAAAGVSGNPSSPHEEGRAAHDALEAARARIARLVECKEDDIIFTSGATEANALAILGVSRKQKAESRKSHILYLPSAHASIVENVKFAAREGAVVEPLPLKGTRVDCEALARLLRPETVLVAMEAVCGETGIVWNTRDVARVLAPPTSGRATSRRGRIWLHVDASQAAWTEKLLRAHFGADLLTLDSSKVCATRGSGCLIAPRTIPLAPLYAGGSQERGLRPGSEAPALAAAFADGLSRAARGRADFRPRAETLRADLLERIRASIPDALVNEASRPEEQAPHILNISFPAPPSPKGSGGTPRDTDYLVALLDEAGFAVSTVSACESASGEPSRAVFAIWGNEARAAATLRISFGPCARGRDLARFAGALAKAMQFLDSGNRT